jgi:gliding motility-associated-like protein
LTVSFNGITYPGTAEYWNFDFASTGSGSTGEDWEIWYQTPGDKLIVFGLDNQGCVDTFFAPLTIDAPLPPLVLECVEEDYYSLTIGWEPIVGANQYAVHASQGTTVVSGNTVVIKNLPDNTPVNISVTATGNTACGPSIAEIECQTLEYIPPRLFIPNVFSPNDDGINDIFYLQGNEYITDINTLRIFDRWGNIVFEKINFQPDDPSVGWNGTFHEKVMNPDVFTYWVEYKTVYNTVETLAGDVTLVR